MQRSGDSQSNQFGQTQQIIMKSKLQQAAEFYVIERKFMSEHGWTEKAYIERYGTTEQPKMGDGGPLIWQADLNALFRARDHFLATLQSEMFGRPSKWRKACPLAAELFDDHLLGLPPALDTIHARRASAKALVESLKHSDS